MKNELEKLNKENLNEESMFGETKDEEIEYARVLDKITNFYKDGNF